MQSNRKFSFSEHFRIKTRAEFDLVLKADTIVNKWFVLYARKNHLEHSRLGIIASKRVMQRANSRNYAKRLIRETFRTSPVTACAYDIVVRTRRSLSASSSLECRAALVLMLSNLHHNALNHN